jgi:hypothetical protein
MYPEAKNTLNYIRKGWHVSLAYVVGFFALLYTLGWHPHAPHKDSGPRQELMMNQQK